MEWPRRFRLGDGTSVKVRDEKAFQDFLRVVEEEGATYTEEGGALDAGSQPDPRHEVDVGPPTVEPGFADAGPVDTDAGTPRGIMVTGEPEVIKTRHEPTEPGESSVTIGMPEIVPRNMSTYETAPGSPPSWLDYEAPVANPNAIPLGWYDEPGDLPMHVVDVGEAPIGASLGAGRGGYGDLIAGAKTPREAGYYQEVGGLADREREEHGVPGPEPVREAIQSADRAVNSVLEPFNRGFLNTALLSGGDEFNAVYSALLGGDDLETGLAKERALNEYYSAHDPIKYGAGRGAGLAPGMALAALPESALSRVGVNTLLGGINGLFSSDSNDLRQSVEDMGWGEVWGMGGGILGETLGKLGPLVRRFGVQQRRAGAAPGTVADNEAILETRGVKAMENALDDAFDEQGLAGGFWPQSAAGVKERLGPLPGQAGTPGMVQAAGARMGGAIDDATAAGVRGNWNDPDTDMAIDAVRSVTRSPPATAEVLDEADELLRIRANELPQASRANPARAATPRELQNKKQSFQEAGKYPVGVGSAPTDRARAAAYQRAAPPVAQELDSTMLNAPLGDIYPRYVEGKRSYQDLVQLSDLAGRQAAAVKNQPLYHSGGLYGAGTIGAGLGAYAANKAGMDPTDTAMAGVAGALSGALLGPKFGRDIAGMTAMGLGKTMGAVGNMASPIAGQVNPHSTFTQPSLTDSVSTLMNANSRAMGPYSDQFFEALSSGDESAVPTLIQRLIQTEPDFRARYLPALRAHAAEQR